MRIPEVVVRFSVPWCLASFVLLALGVARHAEGNSHWPQWRGPDANGVAEGTAYPTDWSPTENIVWKFELPGIGASTPVIWDDSWVDRGTSPILMFSGQTQDLPRTFPRRSLMKENSMFAPTVAPRRSWIW